jgi:hypothetical protein
MNPDIQSRIIAVLDGRAHPLTCHEITLAVQAGLPEGQAVTLGEVEQALSALFMAGVLSASYCTESPRLGWEYRLHGQGDLQAAIPGRPEVEGEGGCVGPSASLIPGRVA